jgi:N-acetylgalactosamine-N,N'-diacetylbacillosaminyl-diphospho-undecaprenol 4-alpha-N-acetylgalactosaminyltransferase
MPKKKIAIIINTLVLGGAEKTAGLLINKLHPEMEIHLMMFDAGIIEFNIPADVSIYQIGKPSSASATAIEVLKLPLYALRIKKYLEKNNIGLVFSILNRPNFIAGYLKLFGYKGRVIMNERTNASYFYTNKTLGGRLGRLLVRKLYSRADRVITNSRFSKTDLEINFGLKNQIVTITTGIDYRSIQQKLRTISWPVEKKEGEFIFCHVGRFHENKNQAMLLHAFAKIKEQGCRLLMIGRGIPANLEKMVHALELEEKVVLKESQKDIWPYYAVADAFVLSSDVEGYPNVIIEAMACGLPVISTDCKWGPREILAPDTRYPENGLTGMEYTPYGILTNCRDASMLARAMQTIMHDKIIWHECKKRIASAIHSFDEDRAMESFKSIIYSFQ